jgi:hypothetical protein
MPLKALYFVLSTVGIMDEPGYWAPEYLPGLAMLVFFLALPFGWKALSWFLKSRGSQDGECE